MLRLVEVPPRFRGGGVRPCVCLLAALLLAVVVTPARSQQDDDFGRDFHWLRSLGGGSVGPSQCEMRPSSAVKVTSVAPNALSRARALAEAAANGTPVPGPLPELVDNSTLMYFPPIRHQPIGDCTCYSSAYYYNTFLQARDEGEDASGGDPAVICSPRFLFLIIAQGGWGATCTEHAMARLSDVGCSNVDTCDYNQNWDGEWPFEAAWVQALRNRTGTLHKIQGSESADIDLEAVKTVLANGSCVVTRADFGANYDDYRDYAAGVGIDNHVMFRQDKSGHGNRHSMCIVGYDDNISYYDDEYGDTFSGAFILANSEGPLNDWYNSDGPGGVPGTKGFMWIAYRMFLHCGPPINRPPQFGYYDWNMPIGDPCHDDEDYPTVYYHDDRPHYRPKLYAVAGLNHNNRHMLTFTGGIGSTTTPDFEGPWAIEPTPDSPYIRFINDSRRVAVDLTDGVELLSPETPTQVFVELRVHEDATGSATMTSADFFQDADGDGVYEDVASTDPTVTVPVDDHGFATVMLYGPHYVYVDDSNTTPPYEGTYTDPYQTIQDGVDNAAVGVLVRVFPGTYNEGVELTSGSCLIGSGAPLTTIDSLNTDEAIYASGVTGASVEGFTIISGADYNAVRTINTTLTLRRCVITASKSGCGADGGGLLELDNCLVTGHTVSGLWQNGASTNIDLINCTVADNGAYGVARWGSGSATITIIDSIVYGNGNDIAGDLAGYAVSYTDIGDGDFAGSNGNISADPQFVSGPYHAYYLSQTAAGQGSDSPCVDVGSDMAVNLGLDGATTRTDAVPDAGTVDMGYHPWPQPVIMTIERVGSDVVITWNARSDISYVVGWSDNLSTWNPVPVGEESSWTDTDTSSYVEKFYRVSEDTFAGGASSSAMDPAGDGEVAVGSSAGSPSAPLTSSAAERAGPGNVRRGGGNVREADNVGR